MDIFLICVLCIACAIMSLTLKKYNPEISLLISMAAGIITAFIILEQLIPAFSEIQSILETAQLNSEYSKILFKSLGICFICEFASNTCDDAGEKALSSKIQLAGKISIVILSLPLLETVAKTAVELILN